MPRNVPKDVRVRTWRDESADYVLVCNLKPDPMSGKVDIALGGNNVKLLTGDGKVRRVESGLAFDFGPFAHALVRLPRQ